MGFRKDNFFVPFTLEFRIMVITGDSGPPYVCSIHTAPTNNKLPKECL